MVIKGLKQHLIFALSMTLATSGLNLIHAAVPDTINYQGYLTNASDEPVNGTENITFKIYSVDTGPTPALWEQTKSVEIKDGKFSIELGDDVPFDPGLFDDPLYLGITVGTDAEMTPRKPLTSAPFAISAGDATTLQGETLNNIIYEDADAVASMGDKLPTNPLNHDRYTNVEAVAAMGTTEDTNSLNHVRYSNSEAVVAMGVKGVGNSLNHDRYSNAEAVTAIKAADGSGSGLDADLLDGQHAADIINAASDEVRTPISSVPYTISTPGSYYFASNLNQATTTNAITVNADHVTINMMGFVLTGPGKASGSGVGIYMDARTNVTIKNGTIREFGYRGIFETSAGRTSSHRVIDVRAINNGNDGIHLLGFNTQVRGCTAIGNGRHGIYTGSSSTLSNNSVSENASDGINTGSGCTLSNNTARGNQDDGIYASVGSTLSNNTAYNNQDDGIISSVGSTFIGNTATENGGWGIYGSGANLIKDNTSSGNNTLNTANQGGIRVGADSRVVGNMVDGNFQNGIYVPTSDNIIDSNHVTDSTIGINFTISGNAYRNNTAAGNTTAYGGTAIGTTTDFNGNVSF